MNCLNFRLLNLFTNFPLLRSTRCHLSFLSSFSRLLSPLIWRTPIIFNLYLHFLLLHSRKIRLKHMSFWEGWGEWIGKWKILEWIPNVKGERIENVAPSASATEETWMKVLNESYVLWLIWITFDVCKVFKGNRGWNQFLLENSITVWSFPRQIWENVLEIFYEINQPWVWTTFTGLLSNYHIMLQYIYLIFLFVIFYSTSLFATTNKFSATLNLQWKN